ncbi:hypothetical protein PVAP13_7NG349466 [Panicum virgatum]|uniref:Uncharacterized protein n=1 Tax=Panicum virgatum TaxID=38727 RepID=A0A8T0PXS1_PANVG|nr:hypothetical protein PVAP13_7NG349466 [Panicum virgatum]
MDDNTDSEGVRSSNEAKRSKQTSREDEHISTSDGGSSRAAVPMNLEGCSLKSTEGTALAKNMMNPDTYRGFNIIDSPRIYL